MESCGSSAVGGLRRVVAFIAAFTIKDLGEGMKKISMLAGTFVLFLLWTLTASAQQPTAMAKNDAPAAPGAADAPATT